MHARRHDPSSPPADRAASMPGRAARICRATRHSAGSSRHRGHRAGQRGNRAAPGPARRSGHRPGHDRRRSSAAGARTTRPAQNNGVLRPAARIAPGSTPCPPSSGRCADRPSPRARTTPPRRSDRPGRATIRPRGPGHRRYADCWRAGASCPPGGPHPWCPAAAGRSPAHAPPAERQRGRARARRRGYDATTESWNARS